MRRGGPAPSAPDAGTSPSFASRIIGSLRVARAALGAGGHAQRSADVVRAAQELRLRRMVEHAYRSVPFYADTMRQLGMTPRDVRRAEDLAELPLVERAAIQRAPDLFRSRARAKSDYLALRSGGSSGAPRVVYHDPVAILENAGHGERHLTIVRRLTGKRRFRTLAIGSPLAADAELRAFVRRHALVPGLALGPREPRTMAVRPEDLARELALIRPDVIFGYGSFLERLAQALEEIDTAQRFVPRLFAYGGDGMSPATRARIVSRLGAAVWSTYQAVECLKIAFECVRGGGLHVHADLCALRIVAADGTPLPDGSSGEVVISNLVNRGTVLLNYRLGDTASLVAEPCPCGSPLPRLSFPDGRVEDWLEVPSGERVYTQRLRALFTDESDVWQYQIVQETVSVLRIAIVTAQGADRAALATRVGRSVAAVVGPGVALRVDFVPELERTVLGKVRTVIRREPRDQAAMPRA